MALLPRLASLWRNLTDKESADHELNEELRAHVDLLTERKLSEGLNAEQARRAALVEVGGIEQVKERVRRTRADRGGVASVLHSRASRNEGRSAGRAAF